MTNARESSKTCSLLALAAFALAGCAGYSKETVALSRDHVSMRLPNQQRLLALSTDEAVARLDFKGLAGKKVVVEMTGIFPHTRQDVLDYIQGQVAGKIARDGGLVISAGQIVVTPDEAAGSNAAVPAGSTISLTPSDADYRVVIGVSWAGVDTHDKLTIDSAKLTRQVGVIVAGLLLGAIGAAIGDVVATPIVSGIGGLGMTAGVIWYAASPPRLHVYRLLGRVRLSVNALPIVPGGVPFQTVGEGQTELLVDPTAEEGYVLQ